MNFWQKTKRFIAPLEKIKKDFALQVFLQLVYHIGPIIPFILLLVQQGVIMPSRGIFIFLIVYVIGGYTIVHLMRRYYWLMPGYSLMAVMNKAIIPEVVKKNNLQYEVYGTGRILSIVDRGIYMWHVLLTNGVVFMIKTSIISAFIFWKMFHTSYFYGLGLIILSIAIFYWIMFNNRTALKWKSALKEQESEHTRRLVKIFMSKFEILQSKKINAEEKWLEKSVERQLELATHRNTCLSLMYDVPYFGFLGGIIFLFLLAYYQIAGIPGGVMLELIAMTLLAQSMLLPFIDFIKDFTRDFVHIEKLWDFLDHTSQIDGYDKGENFSMKHGNYSMKKVNFAYNANKEVFHELNLEIQGGKKTAIVGRSGSGKTTLMKLLTGYMRPTGGILAIDGQDITKIRLDSYYPHIGYLTQEPSVFDGTIRENLLYGITDEENVVDKKIERAIELAECQFIYELPEGLETEIGERGIRLSGGQKQRLAIAKIMLKDPEIILLDEPTAALDSYSEQKVAKAFEHLFEGRTVIVIAHRLQTVKSADDIIVLEKGKIVERGTHQELFEKNGVYAGMVDLQSGTMKEEENNTNEK